MNNLLKDGGHIFLECSNCNKKLVDIFIVKPDAKKEDGTPIKWNCQAECCYCNDKSFIKEISGIFRPAGIIKLNEDSEDAYKNITDITNIDYDDDFVFFKTARSING
jgi:hypothetical protein